MVKIPARNRKGPPPMLREKGNLTRRDPEKQVVLNFRVPAGFHKEFKALAVEKVISMVELPRQACDLNKEMKKSS